MSKKLNVYNENFKFSDRQSSTFAINKVHCHKKAIYQHKLFVSQK